MKLHCHLADKAHTRVRSTEDGVSYNAVNGCKFNLLTDQSDCSILY